MHGHIIQFNGRKDLGQALPEKIKLLFLHRQFAPQSGSVFTANHCRAAEVNDSLPRKLGVNGAPGVVLLSAPDRDLMKLGCAIQITVRASAPWSSRGSSRPEYSAVPSSHK